MSNFSKLIWKPCEIIHNNAYKYENKCIIVIPIYKSNLKETEKASLNQLCKIIGNSYEICLVCPENIQLNEYLNIAYNNKVYFSYLFCSNDYFKSTETYSYLCETTDFYKCFSNYKYMFIYQLDGWIFSNLLNYYIDLNVDYIGGLCIKDSKEFIGNGGISLRNIQKFIKICESLTEDDFKKTNVEQEDLFFCDTLKNKINLILPSAKNASNFSLTNRYSYFISKYNKNHLPMCVHAWDKSYNDVLHEYIKVEYKNKKKIINDKIIINKNNLTNYTQILKIVENKKPVVIKWNNNNNNIISSVTKQALNTTSNNSITYKEYVNKYLGKNKTNNDANNNVKKIENNVSYYINNSLNKCVDYICESNDKTIDESTNERIIITLTSWTKRIKNVHHIIELIMNNTLLPDIININLAEEEFPNKENDLPEDLRKDLKTNKKIKINWVKHNTKVWKKLIPTLFKYPNDVIISIDDDFEYPSNLIETLYNEYLKYDKKYPISGNHEYLYNMQCHCGCASLVKKGFIEPYFYILNEDIMKNGSDDIFYSYCAKKNNNEYKKSPIIFYTNMKTYQNNLVGYSKCVNIYKTYEACEKSFKITKPIRIKDLFNNASYKLLSIPNNNISKNNYIKNIKNNALNCLNILKQNVIKYDLSGKEYNNEKAIISLTSWKARIDTVYLTLYNLLTMCQGFHIVLVLSSNEFPKKELELPENIKLLVHYKLIEILWVKENYKAFKKVLFTLDKYRSVPVISADDDCIYLCNYAKILYDKWINNPECIITLGSGANGDVAHKYIPWPTGSKSLYPPYCFENYGIKYLIPDIYNNTNDDDTYYAYLIKYFLNKKIINPFKSNECNVTIFHDEIQPMSKNKQNYGIKQAMTVLNKVLTPYFIHYKKYFSEILLLIKARNLNDFKDWLKWHLDTLNFDHIVIFDNESDVDIKNICDADNRIEYHTVKGFPDQYKIYNNYINNESKSEWVLAIDDDEYLWMKNFTNVNDMLKYYQKKWPDMSKLSIRWKNMFPNNVNDIRGNISLMEFCKNSNENWAKLFDGGNKPVKTFVNTSSQEFLYDIQSRQTHIPISIKTKDKAYLCNGERMEGNWYVGNGTDDDLKILHYQFKSKEEWIWKCKNRKRVSMIDIDGYNSKRIEIYKKMI